VCREVPELGRERREESLEKGEILEGKEFDFLEVILKGENLVRVEDTEISKGIIDSISRRVSVSGLELPLHWKYLMFVFVFGIRES